MNARKPFPFLSRRPLGQASLQRGFSAIEVTAVAAIIAVLALILIPSVNKRVDESKIVAAKEDLSSIQKAEEVAYGYTGHYYRICDLIRPGLNPEDNVTATPALKLKLPQAYWNKPILNPTDQDFLAKNWTGPYLPSFHRGLTLDELITARPFLFHAYDTVTVPGGGNPAGGPIMVFSGDQTDWNNAPGVNALTTRMYPVDPWGNPYIFFGSGRVNPDGTLTNLALTTPMNYQTAAVYSLGPDGMPGNNGNGQPDAPINYFREGPPVTTPPTPIIGTGDDLVREF